jgi:hypothetical protein
MSDGQKPMRHPQESCQTDRKACDIVNTIVNKNEETQCNRRSLPPADTAPGGVEGDVHPVVESTPRVGPGPPGRPLSGH